MSCAVRLFRRFRRRPQVLKSSPKPHRVSQHYHLPSREAYELQTVKEVTSTSKQLSPFLRLPSELRSQIYAAVLDLPVKDHLALLCACREINAEGREFLFKRPLLITTEADLEMVMARHTAEMVQNINSLELRLERWNMYEIQGVLERDLGHSTTEAIRRYVLQQSSRLIASLSKLSNISEVSLRYPLDATTESSLGVVSSKIIYFVGSNYSRLESLNVEVEKVCLNGCAFMTNLKSLRFSGFSKTDAEDMSAVLSQMKCLKELTVIGPGHMQRWQARSGVSPLLQQSVTPTVLRRTSPLRSLTLCETLQDGPMSHPFFNKDMFTAIHAGHRRTLRELHLASDRTPESSLLDAVSFLLESLPNVIHLSLAWPRFDPVTLEAISSSTVTLEVAADDAIHGCMLLHCLADNAFHLPQLRSVRLNVIQGLEDPKPR